MTTTTKWIGYVRVSTDEQSRSGLGLEDQCVVIEAAVRAAGGELLRIERDEGIGGTVTLSKRPGAWAALEAIARGEADGLCVAKLDRLSRSTIHTGQMLAWFDEAGAKLKVLDFGLDTATPAGRMVAAVVAAVAQFEWERMGERQRGAHESKRRRGTPLPVPTVERDHPEIAARIIAMRNAGATWQACADALNADGIPTARGGTEWRVSSVQAAGGYRRKGKTLRPMRATNLPPIQRRPTRRKAAA